VKTEEIELIKPKKIILKRKTKLKGKNGKFAETIGVEDNENYTKFKNKERLMINFSHCKYFVNHFVAEHLFNFKLSMKNLEEDGAKEDWDILWTDGKLTWAISAEKIFSMKPYQKCNHFPGMFQITRKNNLARNLQMV
jgi:tubulin polyglutamylase TTLL6/13